MTAPQLIHSEQRPEPAGMDRKLEPPRLSPLKLAAGAAALAAGGAALYYFAQTSGVRSFAVERERVTIASAQAGRFLDFIPIRGNVTPLTTVYLDAIEGGRVETVHREEGGLVEQGEPIVELGNTALQLDVISREAQVSEQINNLRNTRLAMEQNRLALRSELVEIDYQITRLTRLAERRRALVDDGLVSLEEYEATVDELEYYRNRREVTVESQQSDARMRLAQIDSLEASIDQLERNLTIARRNLENLTITAPIAGRLTALDAEVGQSKARGERLGRIDAVDDFKVTAQVDEFYLTRTRSGQRAEFTLGGEPYTLTVDKVYPQVQEGQFQVDLAFDGPAPANLRRGQTLQIRLELGDPGRALLLARGGFYQDTGGNWAFVLDESGDYAERRPIRLGRRNPEHFEVLEGLEAGDRVITSEYGAFTDMDRVVLRD